MSCHVMSCHVMSCHVMSCHVMSCHVMSCHVMSCHISVELIVEEGKKAIYQSHLIFHSLISHQYTDPDPPLPAPTFLSFPCPPFPTPFFTSPLPVPTYRSLSSFPYPFLYFSPPCPYLPFLVLLSLSFIPLLAVHIVWIRGLDCSVLYYTVQRSDLLI
jgi:hypothetical protein